MIQTPCVGLGFYGLWLRAAGFGLETWGCLGQNRLWQELGLGFSVPGDRSLLPKAVSGCSKHSLHVKSGAECNCFFRHALADLDDKAPI